MKWRTQQGDHCRAKNCLLIYMWKRFFGFTLQIQEECSDLPQHYPGIHHNTGSGAMCASRSFTRTDLKESGVEIPAQYRSLTKTSAEQRSASSLAQ